MPTLTKSERLQIFYDELRAVRGAGTLEEAVDLLSSTLLSVEDRFSGIPRGDGFTDDGRMYPAKPDSRRPVPGRAELTRFRSRRHNTYISSSGAILIVDLDGVVEVSKAGSNGEVITL